MYKAPSFGLGMKKDLRESIESVYDINNTINEEEQLIISLFEEFLEENFHVEMLTEEDIDYILENEFSQWLEEGLLKGAERVARYLLKSKTKPAGSGSGSKPKSEIKKLIKTVGPGLRPESRNPSTISVVPRPTNNGKSPSLMSRIKNIQKGDNFITSKKLSPLPRILQRSSSSVRKNITEEQVIELFEEFLDENYYVDMLTEEDIDYIIENQFPQWLEESWGKLAQRVAGYLLKSKKGPSQTSKSTEALQKAAQPKSEIKKLIKNVGPGLRPESRNPSTISVVSRPTNTGKLDPTRTPGLSQNIRQQRQASVGDDFIAALQQLTGRPSLVSKIPKKASATKVPATAKASATKVPANAKASATKVPANASATTRNLLLRTPQTPEPEPESKRIYERPYPYYVDPGKDGLLTPTTNTGMPLPAQNPLMPFVLARKNDRELNAQPPAPPVRFRLLNPPPPPPRLSFAPGLSSVVAKTTGSKTRGLNGVSSLEKKPVLTPKQNNGVKTRSVQTVRVTRDGEPLPPPPQRNPVRTPGQNSDSGVSSNTNPNGGAGTSVNQKRKTSVGRKPQPTRSSVDRVMKNTGAPAPPFKGGNTATWTDEGKPVFKSDTIPKRDALRGKSRRPSTRRSPSKTRPAWVTAAFTSER